jgi:hypothetical protein
MSDTRGTESSTVWADFIEIWRDAISDAEEDGEAGVIEIRIDGEWHIVKDGHVETFEDADYREMLLFSTGSAEMLVDARKIQAGRWHV